MRNERKLKNFLGRVVTEIPRPEELQDSLSKLEEKYRTVLNLTPSGIMLIDPLTHHIVDINQTAAVMFGEFRDRMIGSVCRKYVCPPDEGKCPLTMPGMTFDKAECVFLRKDGTSIPVYKTAVCVNLDGRDLLLETFSDISDLKKLQKELLDSQAKYRAILEEMEEAYYEIDVKGIITFVNEATARMYGFPREEMLGMSYKQFTPRDNWSKIVADYVRVFVSGVPELRRSATGVKKDGTINYREDSIFPIRNDKGEMVGLRGISHDVTERKRTELELQEILEDLKRSNAELQRRNDQLSKVREIALGTDKSKTSADVLSLVAERSRELPGVRFVLALKYNEDRDMLVPMYSSSIRDGNTASTLAALGFNLTDFLEKISGDGKIRVTSSQFGIVRELGESNSPIIKEKLSQIMQNVWPEAMCDSVQHTLGIKSFAFVPVILDDLKWGTLAFVLDGEIPLDILEMVSAHCSNALKNIIAYEAFFIAFDSNPIPSAITSFSNGKFIEVNESFLKLIDCSREDVLGRTARELQLWPNADEHARIAPLLRKEHKVSDAEITYRNRSGQIRRGVFAAKILHINNQLCNLMTINDVTERRQMEDEIKSQRDRLAELEVSLRQAIVEANTANQAKSEFLARMSHEIRTPLHGVTGVLELLADGKLELQQQEYLALARSSADSLLGVISDILDFSKIEAGKFELECEEFDLEAIVEASLNTVAMIAQKKGLEIIYQLSPDVPTVVRGDATRLRQILLNLLGNSVKFTERGEILISIDKDFDENGEVVLHFSVKDTGIGISKEKQALIFDAFSQVDGSMERRRGGTGLGLTISRSLVEKMGGNIWVEGDIGIGSTFHFTAKFAAKNGTGQQQAAMEHLPAAKHTELANTRALLIDDNESNRLLLGRWLREWGLQVTEAPDGQSGLRLLKKNGDSLNCFDLILLDKNMPENDGFAVAEQIQCTAANKPVILMMLETSSIGRDLDCCKEMEISNYVVKPIYRRKLFKCILSSLGINSSSEQENSSAETSGVDSPQLSILVAEDNATSQLIAKKMLEKRGHVVSIAGNGVQACEKIADSHFDMVFMDVEMPVMNGLEATKVIRGREKQSGRHIPIVAMTAYATKEDKQKCLVAGVDDFLVKPANSKDIYAMIDKLLREEGKVNGSGGEAKKPVDGDTVDLEIALDAVGGDRELLREALGIFMEQDYPEQLQLLKEGVEFGDAQKVKAAAHSIKGNARTFGGMKLGDLAQRIEEKGRNGDLEGVKILVDHLEVGYKQFTDFFSSSEIQFDLNNYQK
ncbi:MAG: PAS domain S-box protein [Dehalococcoidia bacterium]|nr:PAS domain S-box protein [Dehalococcoidia bacterium]